MKTEQIIRNIFIDTLGVEESEVTREATNNDLGMDSLDKVEVVMAIESHFNVDFTDSDMDECKQFSDYVKLVERKLAV